MVFTDDDDYRTEQSFGRESQTGSYYGESSVVRDGLGRRVLDSFKRDPSMTMTPKGTPGNFTDQETVTQCVVGTRNAASNSTATGSMNSANSKNSTSTTGQGTSSEGSGVTTSSVPVAASTKLAPGVALETLAALAVLMFWVV